MTWDTAQFGHQKLLNTLQAMAVEAKVPHALLFAGPKGVGKFRLARHFAVMLNGSDPSSVRQIEKNIHPDVVTLGDLWQADRLEDWQVISHTSNFDQSHRKGREGEPARRTDSIGVRDIHAFLEPLCRQPVAAYNIGIIRDAERLTNEAANALLKMLEEPPEKTMFLLTTTNSGRIPDTIVSRCQKHVLSLLPNLHLIQFLGSRQIFGSQADELITLSQGRSEHLDRLLRSPDFLEAEREQFQAISQLFSSPDFFRLMRMADELGSLNKQKELQVFIDNFGRFLRSVLIEKVCGRQLAVVSRMSYDQLLHIYSEFDTVCRGLRTNANRRLLAEKLLLSIS